MCPSKATLKEYILQAYRHIYHEGAPRNVPIIQGKDLALRLGYDPDLAENVPEVLWSRFFPCGHLLPWVGTLGVSGPKILNLGSGVGLDAYFLCFGRIVSSGCVANVDTAEEALRLGKGFMEHHAVTQERKKACSLWVQADAERIPFRNEAFDIVLLNGVFNLFEDKRPLLAEIFRVLKRPGALLLADLVRTGPLPRDWGWAQEAWLWCINGSLEEQELWGLLEEAGFTHIQILKKEGELDPLWREVFLARKGM